MRVEFDENMTDVVFDCGAADRELFSDFVSVSASCEFS